MSVVALLAAGLVGLAGYAVGAQSRPERDFSKSAVFHRDLDDGGPDGAEMERRGQLLQRRNAARQHAVMSLLARRLTLRETAARFRRIEKEMPVNWCPSRGSDGAGDDERLCRRVIAAAKYWVSHNLPDAAAAVADRLEAELQQLRGPDGTVCLRD
jgi:hypothetical protein